MHDQRSFAALPLVHHTFWHAECFLQNCIKYVCSSIVIEITVSLAWCVNVLISFYSEKKKNYVTRVLLVHYILWTLTLGWSFLFSCCRLRIEVKWTLNGQWKQTFFQYVEDFFKDVQLCYPKHKERSLADCGMKVNVRIKKKVDILSVINVLAFFLRMLEFIHNTFSSPSIISLQQSTCTALFSTNTLQHK